MTNKDNLLRVIQHNHPHWVPNGMESVINIISPVIERPTQAGMDSFEVEWSFESETEGGTFPTPNGNPIADLSFWREQITLPNLDKINWSSVRTCSEKVDRNEFLVSGFIEMGIFERICLLLGMDEALMAFITNPLEMTELVSSIADYKIDLIKRFDDVAHLDIIWYGDDWGTQENLFLPPDIWREVIKPHTQRIYDCMKKRGIIINQHSCGKIEKIFLDLVEMGADIWNPCQPCNDLAGLKKSFGAKITFCGGIDSQFVLDRPGVTVEEVKAEVKKRIIELSAGGGYIAAPSHSVPYDQNILSAMNETIFTEGRKVYSA